MGSWVHFWCGSLLTHTRHKHTTVCAIAFHLSCFISNIRVSSLVIKRENDRDSWHLWSPNQRWQKGCVHEECSPNSSRYCIIQRRFSFVRFHKENFNLRARQLSLLFCAINFASRRWRSFHCDASNKAAIIQLIQIETRLFIITRWRNLDYLINYEFALCGGVHISHIYADELMMAAETFPPPHCQL